MLEAEAFLERVLTLNCAVCINMSNAFRYEFLQEEGALTTAREMRQASFSEKCFKL